MKKYWILPVLTCLMASSVLADKLTGTFICEQIFSDASEATLVVVIEGNTLKKKKLGQDDTNYREYTLIHFGKENEFKAFSRTLIEDIVTVTFDPEPVNGEYHYNEIATGRGWRPRGRVRYGKCDKI